MVKSDIAGDAFDKLRDTLSEHDLLIFDLVIERRGVHEISPGEYVSRSDEIVASELLKQQAYYPRLIEFGTQEHLHLWKYAADQLTGIIKNSDTPAVFIAPEWADIDNDGEEVLYRNGPVEEINRQYEPYNAYIKSHGIPVATIPRQEAVADVAHRWGRASFHFEEGVYERLLDQVREHYYAYVG